MITASIMAQAQNMNDQEFLLYFEIKSLSFSLQDEESLNFFYSYAKGKGY